MQEQGYSFTSDLQKNNHANSVIRNVIAPSGHYLYQHKQQKKMFGRVMRSTEDEGRTENGNKEKRTNRSWKKQTNKFKTCEKRRRMAVKMKKKRKEKRK